MRDAEYSLPQRTFAEALGAAMLVAIVVGSGIMGQRLSGGVEGIALLANTLSTGAGLIVLILMFGPVSGAHFNPAVSLVMALSRKLRWREFGAYAAAQFAGGIAGAWTAHAMFAEEIFQSSVKARDGLSLAFSEFVATFGLLGAILAVSTTRPSAVPAAVGLYIMSAYWFTASTSFANPAVTVARAFSDTFAGVALYSVPAFVVAQMLGALSAMFIFNWLLNRGNGK